jgi:hypothetical protein
MRTASRTIARLYLVLAAWFLIMLATVLAVIGLGNPVIELVGASAQVLTVITMAIAIVVASLAAAGLWLSLRRRAESSEKSESGAHSGALTRSAT